MKQMRVLLLAIFMALSCGMIGCDWPPPSKPKAENPEGGSIKSLAQTGRYQLFPIDTKTGGTTKTLVFRLDSTNGTTWKLDPDYSKWVLIEGGFPQDPLGIRASKEEIEAAKKRLGLSGEALPKGIPQGSKLIGTTASGGKVYQTPEGKKLVAE